ncbi:MAG: DUF998 domain-containing protein [Methanobacterium sp.]|nr:DUF998 domain-containing protein [Methanobacterium sp.]
MNSRWLYLNLLGLLAFIVFTVFTLTSLTLYPTTYTPLYDWLSNLGNVILNPKGAIFFNLGCIITGLILIPFIVNFHRWNPQQRYQKILIYSVIILGIYACISLIGVGLFPETHIKMHILAASGVFGTLFLMIIIFTIALKDHPQFMRIVALWGVIAIITDLIFVILLRLPQYHDSLADFHPTIPLPGLEWASVYASLIWIALISYNMYKKLV